MSSRLTTRQRRQKATLWTKNGDDDYGGAKVNAKVEIKVRWEEKRSEAVDKDGNTIAIDATVVVDQEIAVGSIMWLGALADVADPPVNLKEVVVYNETPDLKSRGIPRRTVGLVKYSNQLPSLV